MPRAAADLEDVSAAGGGQFPETRFAYRFRTRLSSNAARSSCLTIRLCPTDPAKCPCGRLPLPIDYNTRPIEFEQRG